MDRAGDFMMVVAICMEWLITKVHFQVRPILHIIIFDFVQCYALTLVHCKIILHLLFVGSDITYLYPDLTTCLNGNFVNDGQMEIASLSVIESARIEEGVMVLK